MNDRLPPRRRPLQDEPFNQLRPSADSIYYHFLPASESEITFTYRYYHHDRAWLPPPSSSAAEDPNQKDDPLEQRRRRSCVRSLVGTVDVITNTLQQWANAGTLNDCDMVVIEEGPDFSPNREESMNRLGQSVLKNLAALVRLTVRQEDCNIPASASFVQGVAKMLQHVPQISQLVLALDKQCDYSGSENSIEDEEDDDDDEISENELNNDDGTEQQSESWKNTSSVRRKGWDDIAAAIHGHASLQSIVMDNLDSDCHEQMQQALLSLPHLCEFYTSHGYDFFFTPNNLFCLICQPSMRTLGLYCGNLSRAQVAALCQALRYSSAPTATNTCLERLEIKGCTISEEDFPSHLFAESLSLNQSLQFLVLKPGFTSAKVVLDSAVYNYDEGMIILKDSSSCCEGEIVRYLDFVFPSDADRGADAHIREQWLHLLLVMLQRSRFQPLRILRISNPLWWNETHYDALHQSTRGDATGSVATVEIEGVFSMEAFRSTLSCLMDSKSLESIYFGSNVHCEDAALNCNAIISAIICTVIPTCPSLTALMLNFQHYACDLRSVANLIRSMIQRRQNNFSMQHTWTLDLKFGKVPEECEATILELIQALTDDFYLVCFPSAFFALAPKFRNLIDCIVSMNCAGRCYVLNDPTNKRKGMDVLETARHELNGLYLHLRENSFLCRHDHPHRCQTAFG